MNPTTISNLFNHYSFTWKKHLEDLNIKCTSLNWIKINRSQYVKIQHKFENVTSKIETYQFHILEVENGVPQGSILGPLFINIYVNDITNLIIERHITMYSDDIT